MCQAAVSSQTVLEEITHCQGLHIPAQTVLEAHLPFALLRNAPCLAHPRTAPCFCMATLRAERQFDFAKKLAALIRKKLTKTHAKNCPKTGLEDSKIKPEVVL